MSHKCRNTPGCYRNTTGGRASCPRCRKFPKALSKPRKTKRTILPLLAHPGETGDAPGPRAHEWANRRDNTSPGKRLYEYTEECLNCSAIRMSLESGSQFISVPGIGYVHVRHTEMHECPGDAER